MAFLEAPVLQLITVIISGFIYPAYALFTFAGINQRILEDETYRLRDYRKTRLIFAVLTTLIIINLLAGLPVPLILLPELGLPALIFSILIIAFIIVQARQKLRTEDFRVIRQNMEPVWPYLPKNQRELKYFYALSLMAAVSEELVFRYYLYHAFVESGIAVWLAVILVNILFAITHAGTGLQNILSSFFLGLVFSVIYYFSGLLLLPIIFHATIDISAGRTSFIVQQRLGVNGKGA